MNNRGRIELGRLLRACLGIGGDPVKSLTIRILSNQNRFVGDYLGSVGKDLFVEFSAIQRRNGEAVRGNGSIILRRHETECVSVKASRQWISNEVLPPFIGGR